MNTAAIKLSDTLVDALSVPMEKAQKVERAVENTVDIRLEGTVGKTVPALVERAVATELRHLATREDLKDLKVEMSDLKVEMSNLKVEIKEEMSNLRVEMHKMENRTILWMAGILIVMLGGFIATLFTLLQTRSTF